MSEQKAAGPEFVIQRIYLKDLSYEAPNTPEIFQEEWKPEVEFNLNSGNRKLSENVYEVVLTITVKVKMKDKNAFLIEAKIAGIVTLKGFDEKELGPILGSYCPNVLFPYAREVVSETVNRGGFPPFYLAPLNFDALYQQHLEQQKGKEKVS
jgi:preprotein translocase subunit SecB